MCEFNSPISPLVTEGTVTPENSVFPVLDVKGRFEGLRGSEGRESLMIDCL